MFAIHPRPDVHTLRRDTLAASVFVRGADLLLLPRNHLRLTPVRQPPRGGIRFLHTHIDSVRRGSISTSAKLCRV